MLETPNLSQGLIHYWWVPIQDNGNFFEECKATLSKKEQEQISFFKFKRVQSERIISHGALRLLLGNYLRMDPKKVRIASHKKGKPYSADDPKLYFNTSHSGGRCAFAFSRDHEVGIDIEKLRPMKDVDELIDRNFTPVEQAYINKLQDDKLNRFFRYWTLKEAYLKAIGEGMRLAPDSLEFTIGSCGAKLTGTSGYVEHEDWSFREITPEIGYTGTIAYLGKDTNIHPLTMLLSYSNM
ncbi:MAG: hypothetical protein COA57_11770 [Flavobacteriales bacterium]|nr:4'-phosphopantetheinyl transferase superfamily protein [Bacteroidales bacterium AH-315-I05]PCJ83210.1 MAG: hypothetical protein COA57_11770 [Flavobacteriales bacterium]